MRSAFCTQCGTVLGAQTRFCVNCGARVEETAGAAATPAPGAQPPAAANPQATVAFTPPRQPSAWVEPPTAPAGFALGPAPVTEKGFSVGQMIKFGWGVTTGSFWSVVGIFTLGIVILAVVQVVASLIGGQSEVLGVVLSLVISIVGYPLLGAGYIRMGLKLVDGQPIGIGDYFQDIVLALYLLLASIVYQLIVFVGLLLLVFPAAIWGSQFSMYGFFIIDRRMGPIQALKASSRTTSGAKWDIVALYGVSTFLIYLGAAALLVGMLVVLPVLVVAWALTYRRLLAQTEEMSGPLVV